MRLRTKFVVVVLIITVILSGVVVVSVEVFKRDAVDEANGEVDATARLTADQIDETIRDRRDLIGYVASQSDTQDFDRSRAVLTQITRNTRFYATQLIHRNGTVVDFRGDVTEASRQRAIGNESDEPYVTAALDGQTYVSDPEMADGRPLVVISAPIVDENGTVVGALAGAIYVDQQTFLQSTVPLEQGDQSVTVSTSDGTVLKPPEQEFESSLRATETVETTDWQVTISRDRAGLTGRLDQLVLVQGVSLFVVLGTIVGFAVWDYRANLRQAERLLDGFGALQRGEYDYSLSLGSAEEWEQIGSGFRSLGSGLAAREAALREREQRLEVLNRVLRHNVRNKMMVVMNFADHVGDTSDDPEIESAADSIVSAGQDLADLSDKAQRVKNAFEAADRRIEFDADDLVTDAVGRVRDDYGGAEISHTAPEDVTVVGIPALHDAVENVVENACEHSLADDPTVEVRVEYDGSTLLPLADLATVDLTDDSGTGTDGNPVESDAADTGTDGVQSDDDRADAPRGPTGVARIVVADDGPGIPEHEYAVLSKGTETALEHGSGLGLWLVFWVIDRSGGELAFEDNEPSGTVVTMTLPAIADD